MPTKSRIAPPAKGGFLGSYQALLDAKRILPDPAQEKVTPILNDLFIRCTQPDSGLKRGLMSLFGQEDEQKRGIYIWGGVGRGKSMLMDVFFESLPFKKKRRAHFHAFMLDVHGRIHAWRRQTKKSSEDTPVEIVARQIADEVSLLCLDEFQVHDVADAMILSQLFTALLEAGVWVVATSNRPPESLYQGGLQRDRFMAFIDLLNARLEIVELAGHDDYRLNQLHSLQSFYLTPLNKKTEERFNAVFEAFCYPAAPEWRMIEVQGRQIQVRVAAGNIARFHFDDLCKKALGAADYLAIATQFHTVMLEGIPAMMPEMRNEAKRFVTLIDALYERRVKLICSAAAAPEKLYESGDGSFEFERTASRLAEMQSELYFSIAHYD